MCRTCAWLQSERREHCVSPVPLARCCIFYNCYRQQQTHILTVPILYMVTVARLCGCLPSDFPVHPPPSFSLCVLGDVGGRCFKVLSAKLLKSSQLHRETVDLQVPVTLSSEEVYSTGCSPLYSSLSLFWLCRSVGESLMNPQLGMPLTAHPLTYFLKFSELCGASESASRFHHRLS